MKKLFFLWILLTVHFSLHPWIFAPLDEPAAILEGLRPLSGKSDYLDIVANLFFYVPLGVLGVLGWWKGRVGPGRWLALVAFGGMLSLTLETIQAWVPGRDSSLLDVFNNTVGTLAGTFLGVAFVAHRPNALRLELPSSPRSMPLILIAAWLVSQWFPFLPILRIPPFLDSLDALIQTSSGSLDLADAFVAALLVGRLLRASLASRAAVRLGLAGACLVLPARLFLVAGAVPWPLAAAVVAGISAQALAVSRKQAAPRLLAAAAVLLIALRELAPFQFAGRAEPFLWVPFAGFLDDVRDHAIRVTAGKFFLYGAALWTVREAGAPLKFATAGICGLLFAGEWAQRYVPGRVPESTDAILTLIAALVMLWSKDRPPARSTAPGTPGYDRQWAKVTRSRTQGSKGLR